MDGQYYLCDYFKTCRQYRHYLDLIKTFGINDDIDRQQCYNLIKIATNYAFEVKFTANANIRNSYHNEIDVIDRRLREFIHVVRNSG